MCLLFVFFFQAEDGIRDGTVTGVQTCALPICRDDGRKIEMPERIRRTRKLTSEEAAGLRAVRAEFATRPSQSELLESGEYAGRSEERRVGKECRCRWSPEQ